MHADGKSRRRSFFEALGRAYGASIEYERLSAMSDRALAARNLTRAQIPLQRLGKSIEHLVSVVALCHHAKLQDPSQQRTAAECGRSPAR